MNGNMEDTRSSSDEVDDLDVQGEVDDVDENETCIFCQKSFIKNSGCIQCFLCELWAHVKCTGMHADSLKILTSKKYNGLNWTCRPCSTFAQKYNKTTLKINERLNALEKKIDKVDKVQEKLASIDKEVEELKEKQSSTTNSSSDSVYAELRERDSRRENLVVYELPEPVGDDGRERAQEDKEQFADLCQRIGVEMNTKDLKFSLRLGRYEDRKSRPLLVGIPNLLLRDTILNCAYRLNQLRDPFCYIGISRDLTKIQRDEDQKLRDQMDKLNSELSDEDKKNFQWRVIGKKGERKLIKARLPDQSENRGGNNLRGRRQAGDHAPPRHEPYGHQGREVHYRGPRHQEQERQRIPPRFQRGDQADRRGEYDQDRENEGHHRPRDWGEGDRRPRSVESRRLFSQSRY